jgi:hypothetical protein
MDLTPKQVITELAKTGRHVTGRQLTDWRQRGLMPELAVSGKGRGKGKSYVWTHPDILDRVAFVADHGGWDTPRILIALWSCGFDVPPAPLRAAWLDAIERLSRTLAKRDMDAPMGVEAEGYFDELGDSFHGVASGFERRTKAEGDDMAEFAYQMVQLALALLFGKALPEDFDEEISDLNQHLVRYRPKFGRYRNFGLRAIELDVAMAFRRFTNVFEIRNAVREATPAQFAEAQFIWRVIRQSIALFSPTKLIPQLGLTEARKAQGTLGPLLLSCLIVALRTAGETPLVRLFEVVAEQLDKLETGRKGGLWINTKDLARYFSEKMDPEIKPTIAALWSQLCAGIVDGVPVPTMTKQAGGFH